VTPYWQGDGITLYHGDCRDILPALKADCVITDPPYEETSREWDKWPEGWLDAASAAANSLWCFGSLRLFLTRHGEYAAAGWKLSHDIIWEKQNGSGFAPGRFHRIHEQAAHWYTGKWAEIYHKVPELAGATRKNVTRRQLEPGQHGARGASSYDTGYARQAVTVIRARNMHRIGIHPSEKPVAVLAPLLRHACPPGGLVIDPFAGSGSALETARALGMKAIGIEISENECEKAARRLDQQALPLDLTPDQAL